MEERLVQLKSSSVFLIYYAVYYCICQPQRSWRYLKKQNRNPRMPKAIGSPIILLIFGYGLMIWSVFHPQRAGRAVRQWFHRLPELSMTWYRLAISSFLGHYEAPGKKNTVYYQSCSRFQRYDDPIIDTPTTIESNYASASAREITDITWSSIVLPVSFGLILSAIPIIIIAALSHCHPGSSSWTQRTIMLLWCSSGSILGLLIPLLDVSEILFCIVWLPGYIVTKFQDPSSFTYVLGIISPTFLYSSIGLVFIPWSVFVAPVWGFVIVGQMLKEWGSCVSLYGDFVWS